MSGSAALGVHSAGSSTAGAGRGPSKARYHAAGWAAHRHGCSRQVRLQREASSKLRFSAATLDAFARASTSEASGKGEGQSLTVAQLYSGGGSQVSAELRELSQIQLDLLTSLIPEDVLHGSIVATLYARLPQSFESGMLELCRIASCGPAAPGSLGRAHVESVQTESGHVVLGAAHPSATEEGLVSQTWIALPDSGSIVMPLSWGPLLVGLLLVERSHRSISVPRLGRSSSTDDELDEASIVPELFTAEDKQKLQKVTRSLTIACVMDQKLELLQQQQTAGSQHVSGLVEDARGPLQALCTLGGMLAPRLEEGEPEQDMANAMLVQGERLKAVITQLQDAFKPANTGREGVVPSMVSYSTSPPPLQSQLATELSKFAVSKRLPAPSPSTTSRQMSRRREAVGVEGERAWCNVTSVLNDMLVGVTAMCEATGIHLVVGEGVQKQMRTGADGGGPSSAVVTRPLLPVYVAASLSDVRRALSQVLDSALQRTPRGGAVSINLVREESGYATVWIVDSGLELQPELIDSLQDAAAAAADLTGSFEEQDAVSALQRIRNGQPAGLGLLGIKIATDAVANAGGQLTVHALKQGTGVRIMLPLMQ